MSASDRLGHVDGRVRIPKAATLVATDLRKQIIRGSLKVGEPLPVEAELMKRYDVSRPTLREGLRILESEGLISVKRGARGGARVQLPDIGVAARHTALLLQVRGTTIEDVFGARRVLEPAAVRILAETNGRAALPALQAQLERESTVLKDPDAFASAATEFHQLLVELSGNTTLAVLSGLVFEIVNRHHHASFANAPHRRREFSEEGHADHRLLLELIAAGKPDEAERFWQSHIDGAAERALRTLGAKTVVDLLD